MANKKTTKRALLFSLLSMLLSVTMLMGTTFAWFTDSVTSANNIITSGNLDVELYYQVEGQSDWTKVDANTNIFKENALWEPGHTEVVKLKVVNEGTLALKYQLGVNIDSETGSINVAGEAFLLSDYIKYGVVEGAQTYTRDAAVAAVDATATKLNVNYSKSDALESKEESIVTMVVYMPTTVGNEANYKTGANAPEIKLGLNLFATQYTFEEDSFDKYYDGGAQWLGMAEYDWYTANPDATEFVIGSSEELAGLAAIVNGTANITTYAATSTSLKDDFAGKTIKLVSDLDLAGREWTPIGSFDYDRDTMGYANVVAFKGTFDGQGHTIKNLSIHTPNTDYAGLFACAEAATIKNVNIHNVDIVAGSHAAAILARGYNYSKTTTVTNCHVTGDVSILIDWAYAGGIVAKATGLNISDCSVLPTGTGVITADNRNAVGGIVAWVETVGATTVANCKAANLKLTGWANIGAINGFIQSGCTIDNCSAESIVITKTRQDGIATVGLAAGGWSYNDSKAITITNNTFKNITLNGTYVANEAATILYGGEYAANTKTNFILDNNTQENITNNLIEVKEIKTVDDLKAALENGGNYVLKNDLALTETLTVPNGKNVVLYLNGKTIIGTDTTTKNFSLIDNRGTLTITGDGAMTLTATVNSGWNRYSAVIANNPGGKLIIESGTFEHLGGTDMAYGIDNLTNGKGTYAETVINGGTIKSTYRGIRQFLNGVEAQNILTVNGGTVEGANKSIWMQDPNKNANTGKLTVSADATLKGDVYLFVTAGSTEWPVEATIATKALSGTSTVVSGNVPAGYVVLNDGTKWYVKSSETVSTTITSGDIYLSEDAQLPSTSGDVTISGTKDTEITVKGTPGGSNVTFNGVTVKGSGYATGVNTATATYNDVTIIGEMCLYGDKVVFNNCTFELAKGQYIWTYGAAEVEFNNCTFNTAGKAILIYNEGAGVCNVAVKDCTFNATAGDKAGAIANQNCAAIEIDNFQNGGKPGIGHTLTTEGNTYDSDFSGEWRIKNYQTGDAVTVNGTEYKQIAIDGKLMTIDASKNVTVG